MHLAAYNGRLDVLRELLGRHNCEGDKRDKKVFGVLGYNLGICAWLHAHSNGKPKDRPYCGNFDLFMQLRWTPLYAGAFAGHMKIVQYLIEERACDSAVVTAVS